MLRVIGLVGSALCISACAFLLDFDELQSNADDAGAGSGGSSGVGGSGGSSTGGTGASGACATSCDDGDSCTDDTCDESVAPPVCKRTPKVGVVEDGFSSTVTADALHRVTMVAGSNAFYLGAFGTNGGAKGATLYELGLQSGTLDSKLDIHEIGAFGTREVRSAAGLVADTSAGLQIHAFIALANVDGALTDVHHVRINGGNFSVLDEATLTPSPTYDATNLRRYPVALQVATFDVRGAWVNTDGTISAGANGKPLVAFGDATHTAAQLTAVASAQGQMGVMFAGPEGVFTQVEAGAILPVTSCETRVGVFTSMFSSYGQIPGLWFSVWTKAGTNYINTEFKGLVCGALQCTTSADCTGDQLTDRVRNPVSVMSKRTGDPAGVVYQASAAPFLVPNASGTGADAVLILSLARINFGAVPFQDPTEATELATLELARMPAQGQLLAGPDWPAVALLNDRVAVAWIQPNESGGDDLHVQRLRMCLPQ